MSEQNQGQEEVREPGTTGRYVVTIDPTAVHQGLAVLGQRVGVRAGATAEAGEVDPEALTNPEASVFFPDLGILIAGGSRLNRSKKYRH